MLKTYKGFLFAIILLVINQCSKAQNFMNGSFEINTAGGVDQINMTNSAFNAMMSNVTAIGTWGGGGAGGGDMDIITSSTWGGSGAQNGLYYVGLTGGGSDMITMDLSGPLVGGNTYTLSFYDRSDGGYTANQVEVGLSTSPNSFGTSIYTAPAPVANTWSLRTVTFVAPFCGAYLSVQQNGAFSGSTWLHVDNFSIVSVGGSSNQITTNTFPGSPFCACSSISVPFTSTGTFTAGNVYSVLLSDTSGSFASPTTIGTFSSIANSGTITCNIPCNTPTGTGYQVQVVSSSPVSATGCTPVIISINAAPAVTVNSSTICPGQTANLVAAGATSYTWSAGATVTGVNTADASPVTTTTYTVTGTTAGCSDTAQALVTIGGALNLAVNSPTICSGQTANLVATGATTYTWSAGATSTGTNTADASPAATTTYTVTGTAGGCTGTAVATVTVVASLTVTVNSVTICTGQTANLVAGGANTYTWSAGATSTGSNTADASPATTTTYTVTGFSGACSSTAIATVTVSNGITVLVNSPSICNGQVANLTATGATSYSWSAGATSTGTNTATASPITTTSYTVTGTSGTCTNTAVATVTVNAIPNVNVNSVTICTGDTAFLVSSGAQTYTWSAGPTVTGVNTAYAYPVSTTTYTVTGTSNTCTNTAVSTVTVNPLPVILVNSDTICSGQTANLTATGATTYTWTAGATSTGGGNATATPIVTASYTITGTTGACIGTGVATVTVNALPPVTVNSPNICAGQTANLTATGATSYTWTAGATSSGGGNATATPGATSSYTVTGTLGLCSNTAVATVTVNAVPNVSVTSAIICSGQTASLTASGASTYTWSAGATSTGVGTANASPTSTTVYIVTGANGSCSDTAQATVIVNNCISPFANFVGNPKVMCDSGCVNFSDISMNTPTSWTWQFPGGVPSTATAQSPVQICYNTIGQYDVTLIVSNAYGTDTLTRTGYISVVPPIPVTITGDTYILPCESSHLTANPPGSAYYWGPSVTGSCNICQEAIVTPVTSQPYYCEYTDVNGCHSADTILINVSQHYTYFMPTAFSPNADLINDVLFVYGVGIDNIQLDIYDRVGEKVFETSDILKGWDGTYLGVPLNEDSFVYALVVTYCNGNIIKENGSVLLEK